MTKSPHAFRSIGEVARMVGVAPHVLRYWETQFPALAPVKRPDGRRYYRPDDVMLAGGVCEALREEGLTIRGVRRLIALDKGAGLRVKGRARLGEMLGLPPEPPPATVAAPDGTVAAPAQTPEKAAPAILVARPTRRRAATRPATTDAAGETLPLFPDLDPPPVTSAPAADSPTGAQADGVLWLGRLCALAAALRVRDTPLPWAAHPLAAMLREQHDAARL